HFTVDIPCGSVSNISNSRNFAIEVGKDPTTGITGFKIDDISKFGEGSKGGTCIVSFTVCKESETCEEALNCWNPKVAYKAGTCVYLETLESPCDNLKGSLSPINESCFGSKNGSIEALVTGGTPPYSYSWSSGSTSSKIEN